MTSLLIFSDLDGTLLDHHTYSFKPAQATLESLKARSIPCVINTSKTFQELIALRQELNHQDPFIVENGAAVYIPKSMALSITETLEDAGDYWVKTFGPRRERLIELSNERAEQYSFTRFSDMSCEQLMDITSLKKENAELAMQREFTEPMLWQDSDQALAEFQNYLAGFNIQIQKGGRFYHLMGKHCDKAHAMAWLAEAYEKHTSQPLTTVALGDGENDLGMLGKADIPVVIRSPVHEPPKVPNRADARLTEAYGPEGWAQTMNSILKEQGIL